MDHTNHTVVVTGGASGIGGATVALLAERGAHVYSLDVLPGASFHTDVASFDQVRRAVDEVAARHGLIDAVVASAGIQAYGTALTTTDEANGRRAERR